MSRVIVFLIIKELTDKAGVNKKISPHTFRHSFATFASEWSGSPLYPGNAGTFQHYHNRRLHPSENRRIKDVILSYHPRNITQGSYLPLKNN
jgi:integrase/recombinase XerD